MVGELPLGWDGRRSVSSHAPTPLLGFDDLDHTAHGRRWGAVRPVPPLSVFVRQSLAPPGGVHLLALVSRLVHQGQNRYDGRLETCSIS